MPRRPSYAARAVLAVALVLATGCSGGPEEPDRRPDAASPETLDVPELEDDGPAAGSGAPEFRGRLPLSLSDAVRRVVDDPCSANQIERLCGSNASFTVRAVGEPRDVTLLRATTDTERSGLTWAVRLSFAAGDAPLPRPDRGGAQVLEADDGLQVVVDRDAAVAGRTITLTGLGKREAWGLVDLLAGR